MNTHPTELKSPPAPDAAVVEDDEEKPSTGNKTLPPHTVLDNPDDYVQAILDPDDMTFPQRLECPTRSMARFEGLKAEPHGSSKPRSSESPSTIVKYFFALDLTQCVELLPRLLGSVVETLRFLGPENCALSIIEGNSDEYVLQFLFPSFI